MGWRRRHDPLFCPACESDAACAAKRAIRELLEGDAELTPHELRERVCRLTGSAGVSGGGCRR